jgi:hypothetical protein
MTRQYLAGELSMLLRDLAAATADPTFARRFADLRYEAETTAVTALGEVALRALALSDDVCWQMLDRVDTVAFASHAGISAELHEFGVCAGLLPADE